VTGSNHLVAGKQTLCDFQVLQVPAQSSDGIETPLEARLRALDHRHPEDPQALDRDVAGLDQNAVGRPTQRIGPSVPGRRDGHGVDERRHPADVPPGIVREHVGADGQPLGPGERAS